MTNWQQLQPSPEELLEEKLQGMMKFEVLRESESRENTNSFEDNIMIVGEKMKFSNQNKNISKPPE